MKILYSINNSIDSQIFLSRALKHLSKHTVKTCMFGTSNYFNVDLNLNYFLDLKLKYSFESSKSNELANWIRSYNPDLVIIDDEEYVGFLAQSFNYKIVNCSFYFYKYDSNNLDKRTHSFNDKVMSNVLINGIKLFPFFKDDIDFKLKITNNRFTEVKLEDLIYIRPYFNIGNKIKKESNHLFYFDKKICDQEMSLDISSQFYYDSIVSSKYCLTELSFNTVADLIYNQKYIYYFKPKTAEDYFLSKVLENNNLGKLYNGNFNIDDINCLEYSDNLKYLHEIIEKI